jgi:two-component system, chemotaxis family, chemotaxis protein CheY
VPFDRTKPVLVIDDNFAIIRIVKALLGAQGINDVEGAGSGPEAIRKLSQKQFGIIICDFFMMPMNGIDLKKVMERRPDTANIPFLLMTTKEETFDRTKFERANVRHIILKPFTADSLMEQMDRAVDGVVAAH